MFIRVKARLTLAIKCGILTVLLSCLFASCTFLDPDPDQIGLVFSEADQLVSKGNLDEAEKKLQWLMKQTPLNPRPYNNLGNIYYRKGAPDKAAALYQKALDLNPGYLVARVNLAVLSLNYGKIDEAYRLLGEGVKEYPRNAEVHNGLGVCELKRNRIEAAVDHFRKAIDLQGFKPLLYNNLAYAYAESNEYLNEALKMAKEALKAEPENPIFMDTLGWIYFKRGVFDQSVEFLDRALSLNPRSEEVRSHLATVYRWTGQNDRAVALLKDAIRFRVMSDP